MHRIYVGLMAKHAHLAGIYRSLGEVGPRIQKISFSLGEPSEVDLDELLHEQKQEILDEETVKVTRQSLQQLFDECRTLHLRASTHSVSAMMQLLDQGEVTLGQIKREYEELGSRLVDELTETLCYMIEPIHERFFGQDLFGGTVANRFPGIAEDIEEASKCLAFDRGTACVFHLMRVIEVGLQELAKDLGIQKLDRNWQNLLNEIDKAIRALPFHTTTDKEERGKREGAAAHLRNIKNAWRNDAVHPGTTYTVEQATKLWHHTEAFMCSLAEFV